MDGTPREGRQVRGVTSKRGCTKRGTPGIGSTTINESTEPHIQMCLEASREPKVPVVGQ